MLTVVIVKNPFNIQERNIYFPEWKENKTVLEYCNEYIKSIKKLKSQDDIVYSLNGKKVETSVIPNDGDYIALCPVVGKKGFFGAIFGAVLMIGLSMIAPHLGGVMSAMWFGASTVATGLLTAGIMLIGGLVINALFPFKADTAKLNDSGSSATTYTWNRTSSVSTQGGALAVTYGTYLNAGTILFRHIKCIEDEEYLIMLLAAGQGPIDEISDIRINEMPITNYDGVEYECRAGLNFQEPISMLDGKTYADQNLNYELIDDGTWCYATTEGNCGTNVEITLTFPQGLYYLNDDGDVESSWVDIMIEGRVHDDTRSVREITEWLPLYTFRVEETIQKAFSRSYEFGPYAPDRFDVRVRCSGKAGSSYRHINKVQWTMLSHAIICNFIRPGKALVGLKVKATNQLSNDINVTWLQRRSTVYVWNPTTKAYEGKPATNPAWAAYDMIHRARPLETSPGTNNFHFVVEGIPAKYIDYSAFSQWAYRNDMWSLTFNYIFSNCDDLWSSLSVVETVGIGKVLMRGTKITCIYDHFSDPVQLFTTGNINEGSFQLEYLPMKDRANAIEVSYVNRAKRYQKDTVNVYTTAYNIESVIKNPTQLSLDGCVEYEQAIRYANYHLNHNGWQTRTCSIDVDIDSLACTIGDQILIQHDLPLWGYGGIIIDYDESNRIVTLDQHVNFNSKTKYQMLCRVTDASSQDSETAETLEYRDITPIGDSPTNTVRISSKFDYLPQYGDVYAIGKKNKIAKPFIIVSIERKSNLQATLHCIEYAPEAMNENYVAPDKESMNFSMLDLNDLR